MTDSAPARARWPRRLLIWALALVALGFVAYVVPIRDRCAFPDVEAAAKVAVTRIAGGCVVHAPAGDVTLSAEACGKLRCEPGLASTLAHARIGLVAALALVHLLGTFAWAMRWHALLRLADVRVSLGYTWRITLEALAGGVVLPGGIAGDALRIGAIVGKGAPTATVVASVLLDRVLGLATLAGLAAGLAGAFDPAGSGPVVWVLGAIPFGTALGVALLRVPALRRAKVLEHRLLAATVKPVLGYLGDARAPRALLGGILASVVVSAVQLGIVRGLCAALHDEPSVERWVYTGAAISFIIAALPTLPGGWGTADAAFVVFLGRAGIGAPTALAVSLLYRLYWYASAALGAVLYVVRRRA